MLPGGIVFDFFKLPFVFFYSIETFLEIISVIQPILSTKLPCCINCYERIEVDYLAKLQIWYICITANAHLIYRCTENSFPCDVRIFL